MLLRSILIPDIPFGNSLPFCAARVAVEVVTTMTSADVMWQDGTVETNIRSNELIPVHHLDNNEFCPGDFVVDKRGIGCQNNALNCKVLFSLDPLICSVAVCAHLRWAPDRNSSDSAVLVGMAAENHYLHTL